MKSEDRMNYGHSPEAVRRYNLGLIFGIIQKESGITRSQLAQATRLAKPSVSEIVNELIEAGYVEEAGVSLGSVKGGRKPIALQIVWDSAVAIGVDIRRNHISAVMVNLEGKIIERRQSKFNGTEKTDEILKVTFKCISDLIKKRNNKSSIVGIGVGVPGPIDSKEGIILNPPNFEALHNVKLKEILEDKYKVRVFMQIGAAAGAAGEYFIQTFYGRNNTNLAFIELDLFIGFGMVANQDLLQGYSSSGAIGHMIIEKNGRECYCGRKGCLTQYASGHALLKQLGLITIDKNTNRFFFDQKNNMSDLLDSVVAEVKKGNERYIETVAEASDSLADGIMNLFNLVSPHHLVLGSSIPGLMELFWKSTMNRLTNINTIEKNVLERIKKAHFGNDAIAAGGATMALSSFYGDPKANFE